MLMSFKKFFLTMSFLKINVLTKIYIFCLCEKIKDFLLCQIERIQIHLKINNICGNSYDVLEEEIYK